MYFFTATFNSWQLLLADDVIKKIIADSLQWMHQNNRARTHGFVIMPNHIYLLWSPVSKFHEEANEQTLLRFTGHAFKKNLLSCGWRDANHGHKSVRSVSSVYHFEFSSAE